MTKMITTKLFVGFNEHTDKAYLLVDSKHLDDLMIFDGKQVDITVHIDNEDLKND